MKINSNHTVNWYIIVLIVFFLSEALYKYFITIGLRDIRIAGVVKFLFQLFMFFVVFKNWKSNKKQLFLLGIICSIYVLGQLLLPSATGFISKLEFLNNSLFAMIMFLFFTTLNLSKSQKEQGLKVFEWIIIINSIAIFFGLIFNFYYFTTYLVGGRFGFDGFLVKSSYASYFYLIAIFYYTHKYFIKKQGNFIFFIILFSAAVLTGTKASLLAIVLALLYVFLKKKLYKKKAVLVSLFLLLSLFILSFSTIYAFFLEKSETFRPIIENKGFFTAVFSYRNLILTEETIPYIEANWGFFNYFFGGIGDIITKSGFDFIDLFYSFGIIGMLLYVYTFKLLFFTFKINFDSVYFLLTLIIVSSLGGNLFYNSSIAVFLCAMKFYFELNTTDESKHT